MVGRHSAHSCARLPQCPSAAHHKKLEKTKLATSSVGKRQLHYQPFARLTCKWIFSIATSDYFPQVKIYFLSLMTEFHIVKRFPYTCLDLRVHCTTSHERTMNKIMLTNAIHNCLQTCFLFFFRLENWVFFTPYYHFKCQYLQVFTIASFICLQPENPVQNNVFSKIKHRVDVIKQNGYVPKV